MSYVGNSPNYQNFARDRFNGGGASHTLTYTPGSQEAIMVFVDGVYQHPTTDYTVSGTTLTPTTVWPTGTNNVVVVYLGRSADVGTPSDGTVSAAKLAATAISGQTEDTSPDIGSDYALIYDASAAALKKVLLHRASPVYGTYTALSGTGVDVTSIPSWVRRIEIAIVGASLNGTAYMQIQIGDSGGLEATNYNGACSGIAGSVATVNMSSGFVFNRGAAASGVTHGIITLILADSATNTWVCSGSVGNSDSAVSESFGGSKALSATLDRLRITTSNGTDTWDAGSFRVIYS